MGVKLLQDISTYEVTGTTPGEMRASLAERARLQPDGTSYPGFTRWNIRYEYSGARQGLGGCSPIGATVHLELKVRYPTWTDSLSATPALRQEWTRFLTALKAHEGKHAAIAIKGANRLVRELSAIATPACGNVSAEATNLFNAALVRLRRESAEYDELTRHGVTEGAAFGAGAVSP
jgi:predicted secreted Zn-dependent protease